jgi:hypothetical protein
MKMAAHLSAGSDLNNNGFIQEEAFDLTGDFSLAKSKDASLQPGKRIVRCTDPVSYPFPGGGLAILPLGSFTIPPCQG